MNTKYLAVIPLANPFNWPADYELQTAKILSKKHIVILFAVSEGYSIKNLLSKPCPLLKRIDDDLYLFKPIYLVPFQKLASVQIINSTLASIQLKFLIKIRRSWHLLPKIIWIFSFQYLITPKQLGHSYFSIYDCVDAMVANEETINNIYKQTESKQIKQADVIFAFTHSLKRTIEKEYQRPVYYAGPFFDKHAFANSVKGQRAAIPSNHKKIIGYIGQFSWRLDFKFLHYVINNIQDALFVFIGTIDYGNILTPKVNIRSEVSALKKYDNVYFAAKVNRNALGQYISNMKIGLIPYDITKKFNQFCFPLKTLEYLYFNKPIISTDLPELRRYKNHISIVKSGPEAVKQIRSILKYPTVKEITGKQIAEKYTWEKRLKRISRILKRNYNLNI